MPNHQSSIIDNQSRIGTGTREWSEHSVNIQLGCEHGCRYCYAKYDAVCRYRRCTGPEWSHPVINQKKVDGRFVKLGGVVMFPTCHDITPRNLPECLVVIRKLLEAGNQLLIVSKPHWQCLTMICETLKEFRRQITFRFTIGSASEDVLDVWEPKAPTFKMRIACLKYAFDTGYATSVSCEPFLDPWPEHVYEASLPFLTDSFWLGILNKFEQRVDLGGIPSDLIARFVEPVRKAQTPGMIEQCYKFFEGKPYIKFKDSIRKIIGRA